MTAFINQDITINQNADQHILFNNGTPIWNPNGVLMNITGYSAQLMFKINKTDGTSLLTLLITPTAAGSLITLGGTAATVDPFIAHADANTLTTQTPGLVGFYDLVLYSGAGLTGTFTRFMQGAYLIDQAVTR